MSGSARTPPTEPVNAASSQPALRPESGGVEPISPAQPFLSHLSLSWRRQQQSLSLPTSVLSMNCRQNTRSAGIDNAVLCTPLLTKLPILSGANSLKNGNEFAVSSGSRTNLIHRSIFSRTLTVHKFQHRLLRLFRPDRRDVKGQTTRTGRVVWRQSTKPLDGSGFRLFLGLGGCLPAFEVGKAAFAFLNLVALLAHKSLYNVNPIRMLGREL